MDEYVVTIRFMSARSALSAKKKIEETTGLVAHVYDYKGNEGWMDDLKEVTV